MASYNPIVKNGASGAIFYVSLAPQTATGGWQSNPTLAAGDVKISLDGGTLNNLTTLPVVAPAASKLVKVTLSQAETNADNIIVIFSDVAGAQWCDLTLNLQTVAANFDVINTAVAALPTAAANAAGLLDLSNAVETGLTVRGALRLLGAVLAGKVSGAGTGTETFRNAVADSKNRIVSTVDSSGNRTSVTTDGT